jgi:threonine synthase
MRSDRPCIPRGPRSRRTRRSRPHDCRWPPRPHRDRRLPGAADPPRSGGTALSVSDAAMVNGMRRLGRLEGVSAAPEGGAALAALDQLVASETIRSHDVVVLLNTGGALKYLDVLAQSLSASATPSRNRFSHQTTRQSRVRFRRRRSRRSGRSSSSLPHLQGAQR